VNLPLASVKYVAGGKLWIRMQAVGTGPTSLQARAWLDGTTEPAAWQVSLTDSSPELQSAGSVGLVTYLAGSATNAPVVASFDDFSVRKTQP
jgi:hypothetical protein